MAPLQAVCAIHLLGVECEKPVWSHSRSGDQNWQFCDEHADQMEFVEYDFLKGTQSIEEEMHWRGNDPDTA